MKIKWYYGITPEGFVLNVASKKTIFFQVEKLFSPGKFLLKLKNVFPLEKFWKKTIFYKLQKFFCSGKLFIEVTKKVCSIRNILKENYFTSRKMFFN